MLARQLEFFSSLSIVTDIEIRFQKLKSKCETNFLSKKLWKLKPNESYKYL